MGAGGVKDSNFCGGDRDPELSNTSGCEEPDSVNVLGYPFFSILYRIFTLIQILTRQDPLFV